MAFVVWTYNISPENSQANYVLQENLEDTLIISKRDNLLRDSIVATFSMSWMTILDAVIESISLIARAEIEEIGSEIVEVRWLYLNTSKTQEYN